MATKSQFLKPGVEVRSDGVFSKLLSRKRATKIVKTFKKLKFRFFLSLLSKDSEICWLRWPSRSKLCFVSIDSYYFQQAIAIELLLIFQECEEMRQNMHHAFGLCVLLAALGLGQAAFTGILKNNLG